MGPESEDRRQHRRHEAALQIVLRVELHGFDAGDARFEACGRTRNVSCGGLLARSRKATSWVAVLTVTTPASVERE